MPCNAKAQIAKYTLVANSFHLLSISFIYVEEQYIYIYIYVEFLEACFGFKYGVPFFYLSFNIWLYLFIYFYLLHVSQHTESVFARNEVIKECKDFWYASKY